MSYNTDLESKGSDDHNHISIVGLDPESVTLVSFQIQFTGLVWDLELNFHLNTEHLLKQQYVT